jgi:hypothetical protein
LLCSFCDTGIYLFFVRHRYKNVIRICNSCILKVVECSFGEGSVAQMEKVIYEFPPESDVDDNDE